MFTKYESGAEVDIDVVAYVESGAEKEADGAYKYADGAEAEVWSNVQLMKVTNNSLTATYNVDLDATDTGFRLACPFSSGSIDVTLEGTFVNPTITYSYSGGMYYYDDTGSYDKVAGRVRAFAYSTSGGYTNKTRYNIGSTDGFTSGTITETFTGTFTKIGLEVTSVACGMSEFTGGSYMSISNITINGKKCALDPADAI